MGKQVCEYDVQRILDAIGNENILLQLDDYESYLNALNKIDVNGQIRDVVSPGDCTDLSSTIDQELGSFVKTGFNDAFKEDFRKRPDDWQMGKVSAKGQRILFTRWTCDAVEAIMKREDIILRAFRWTGVGNDIEGKMIAHIRFPGFETYEPPTKDEEHLDELLTEDEIKELKRREIEYQKQQKKRKEGERVENMRKRAKKKSSEIVKFF